MRDAWWAHLSKVLRPALASSQFVPHELDDTGKWFIHPNPNDFHLDKNMKLYSQGWKNNFQRTSQKSADGNFVYFATRTNQNKTIILCSYYNSFGFSLIYLIFSDFFKILRYMENLFVLFFEFFPRNFDDYLLTVIQRWFSHRPVIIYLSLIIFPAGLSVFKIQGERFSP